MTNAKGGRKPRQRRSRAPKGPSAADRARTADLLRGRLQNIVARLSVIETRLGIIDDMAQQDAGDDEQN